MAAKLGAVLGVLAYSIPALLTVFASSIEQLTVFRCLAGLGIGGVIPNIVALLTETAPKRFRVTFVMAVFVGYASGNAAIGQVAAWLIPEYGWSIVFLVAGSAGLVLSVFLAVDASRIDSLSCRHKARLAPFAPAGRASRARDGDSAGREVPISPSRKRDAVLVEAVVQRLPARRDAHHLAGVLCRIDDLFDADRLAGGGAGTSGRCPDASGARLFLLAARRHCRDFGSRAPAGPVRPEGQRLVGLYSRSPPSCPWEFPVCRRRCSRRLRSSPSLAHRRRINR